MSHRNNNNHKKYNTMFAVMLVIICFCVFFLSACSKNSTEIQINTETSTDIINNIKSTTNIESKTIIKEQEEVSSIEETKTEVKEGQNATEESIEKREVQTTDTKQKVARIEQTAESRIKALKTSRNTTKKTLSSDIVKHRIESKEEILNEKKIKNRISEINKSEKEKNKNYQIVDTYVALQEGMSGKDIEEIQKKLISLGYLNDVADGKYGPITQQAVKAFQKEHTITEEGIGEQTLLKLGLNATEMLQKNRAIEVNYADTQKLGTAGRLYIPSVDIAVALYWCTNSADAMLYTQAITNAWDSAYAFYDPTFVIGDHNNQEFTNLFDVQVDTEAYYINTNNEIFHLTCVGTGVGYTDGWKIYDQYENSWDEWEYYLVTYTSVNNPEDLFVAEWQLEEAV